MKFRIKFADGYEAIYECEKEVEAYNYKCEMYKEHGLVYEYEKLEAVELAQNEIWLISDMLYRNKKKIDWDYYGVDSSELMKKLNKHFFVAVERERQHINDDEDCEKVIRR